MPRVIDVIEYSDPTGMEIVHKVPEDGQADIRWGAQLIVRESQAAVFFRDGKALDIFSPGRYTLTTGNLPLFTSFLKLASAGKTPFQAEVYFVNQKVFSDLKWGTKEPIVFRDAELSMVRLRAFGTYAVRIVDPQLFVNTLAGTQGLYTTETLGSYLKGIIVSRLNDLLGTVMKTILDLGSKYDELSAALKLKVKDDFAEYGVDLKDFFVQAITPPEDVQKMIDERTSMGAVGDMGKFMQYKTAKAIGDMATNTGGASSDAMGMGAGFGVGMMIPGMVKEAMSQQPAGAGTQAAPAGAVKINCPKCKAEITQGSKFCLNCGEKVGASLCPNCKAELPVSAKFCSSCGTKIS